MIQDIDLARFQVFDQEELNNERTNVPLNTIVNKKSHAQIKNTYKTG